MKKFEIETGAKSTAIKTVIYGPEGVGKTTLASQFPNPLFIDLEKGSNQLDVRRFSSTSDNWTDLLDQIRYILANPDSCKTVVIDTADTAENLCIKYICKERNAASLEEVGGGYGKGYTILGETFLELIELLNKVIDAGINVVIISHAKISKFEEPQELNTYDRYSLKLSKKVEPIVKEWSDLLLFVNHKTIFEKVDKKYKATDSTRKMYTTRRPGWDAKTRFILDPELDLKFDSIAHLFNGEYIKPDVIDNDFSLLEDPDFIMLGANETTDKLRSLISKDGLTEAKVIKTMLASGIKPEVNKPENEIRLEDYSEKVLQSKVLKVWDSLSNFIRGN